MTTIWIIIISLFLLFNYLFWRITNPSFVKEYGDNKAKLWGPRAYYWQFGIYISTGLTLLTIFLLKWGDVLTF